MQSVILQKTLKILSLCFLFYAGLHILKKYDHSIFLWINPDTHNFLSYVFIFVTTLMDGIIILIVMSAAYPIRKNYFFPGLCSLALVGILVYILKEQFAVSRPVNHFRTDEITILGKHLKNYSFPSGHAAASMVFALYLKGNSNRLLVYLMIGIIGGLSRVLVGVHFPSDIWAGGWLGYWCTKLVFFLFEKNHFLNRIKQYSQLFYLSVFVGIVSGIVYLFLHPIRYKEIDSVMIPLVILLGITLIFSTIQRIVKKNRD